MARKKRSEPVERVEIDLSGKSRLEDADLRGNVKVKASEGSTAKKIRATGGSLAKSPTFWGVVVAVSTVVAGGFKFGDNILSIAKRFLSPSAASADAGTKIETSSIPK